jgi:hypothetical protein
MPEDFHRLIVGEALRLMARSDEAFNVLIEKSQQYERLAAAGDRPDPQIYEVSGRPLA